MKKIFCLFGSGFREKVGFSDLRKKIKKNREEKKIRQRELIHFFAFPLVALEASDRRQEAWDGFVIISASPQSDSVSFGEKIREIEGKNFSVLFSRSRVEVFISNHRF